MTLPVEGIHHVTAITGDAQANVDFYTRVLGLRLNAKSVNQDDPTVYHLFYGDEVGSPGADLTFFEYPRAIPGRPGAGMVHRVVWRVASQDALDFWVDRFSAEGIDAHTADGSLRFADGEGLQHELVINQSSDPSLIADHLEIPAAMALQGFEGVRAYSADPEGSYRVLEDLLGAARTGDRFELRGEQRGGWIAFDPAPSDRGNQSAGVIHHVAFGIHDDHVKPWLQELVARRIGNSGRVDRHYFESLYFREPGGILYELATMGPGFTVDGPVEEFGTKVILPPWFEPHREVIEAQLTPLPDPRADWPERSTAATPVEAGS
jgi:glyoxalase family protein